MLVEFPDLEGGLIMRNGANVEHVVCSIRIYVNDIHAYSRRRHQEYLRSCMDSWFTLL